MFEPLSDVLINVTRAVSRLTARQNSPEGRTQPTSDGWRLNMIYVSLSVNN
jgi:hypothetical protein